MRDRVLNFFGTFLIFIGGAMSLPLLIAMISEEKSSIRGFFISIIISMIAGSLILVVTSKRNFTDTKLRIRDTYFIVTASWLLASFIGSLPFYFSGEISYFPDAFFETCSGFTTTGATILDDVDSFPRSLLFWRSFTHWLGGMGIMVLFMALVPRYGIKAQNIANAETPGPIENKLSSRFSGTAQRLYLVYLGLTVILIILLRIGGLSLFDAVTHSMSTMATGGFSTHSDGIAYFQSDYVVWVLSLFMFLAGINFSLFFVLKRNGLRAMLRNEEFKLYTAIVIVAIVLITISLITAGQFDSFYEALTDAAFETVTTISTTGFSLTDFTKWPAFPQMILVTLMLTGACSSSTAGGIKIVRILVICKLIKRLIKSKMHDNMIEDIKLDGKRLSNDTVTYIIAFCTTYVIILIIGTMLVSIRSNGDLLTDFTATLSCISNVGPGLQHVGPEYNYHFYSGFGKVILSLIMIMGRLEITTFLIIFTSYFWNNNLVHGLRIVRQRNDAIEQ